MTTYTGGWEESTDLLGNGLICDVGLYSGPWPPPAPYVENLPLDAGEVDYLVCLPNPDGIADHVIDGSYPTVWRWTETWWTSAPGGDITTDDFGLRTSGGAAAVDALPAGAHLFVLWYDTAYDHVPGIPQPSKAALDLVPPGWVVGAGGSESGHWSAWQDPIDLAQPGAYQDESGAASLTHHFYTMLSGASAIHTYATLSAAIADLANKISEAAAPTGVVLQGSVTQGGSSTSALSTAAWAQLATATADVDSGVTSRGSLRVSFIQWIGTVVDPGYADDLPSLPDPLSGLEPGTDYDHIPGTDVFVEYETSTASRVGWEDWAVLTPSEANADNASGMEDGNPAHTTHYNDWASYASFRKVDPAVMDFAAIYAAEVGGHNASGSYPVAAAWPAPGIGTELDRITVQSTGGNADPESVSLAGAGDDETFTIVMQPSIMLGDLPPTHYPTLLADGVAFWEASNVGGQVAIGLYDVDPPKVHYRTPRWRYWIPGVRWHTVGGHFATVGGATMKILTPLPSGNVWVPVVDGPA